MLELEGVSKRFGAAQALHPLSLRITPGHTTVLLGPSGCGKSTLLKLMNGLMQPDTGRVLFDGTPLAAQDVLQARRRMGYCLQGGGLFPHLSAADNVLLLLLALGACSGAPAPSFRVGSKKFTESVLLGELAAQLAASAGARVEHRRELGGTRVLWEALLRGELDAYPEYTGTLRQELLAGQRLPDDAALAAALARQGVRMSRPLGFNNTYALGMREAEAQRLGIRRISDLPKHPALQLGFSNEFMGRADGWPSLRARYALGAARVTGLDHDLAYRALQSGAIQVTDLYATDPEVKAYALRVLEDDLHHFPAYDAVLLTRADWAARAPSPPGAPGGRRPPPVSRVRAPAGRAR